VQSARRSVGVPAVGALQGLTARALLIIAGVACLAALGSIGAGAGAAAPAGTAAAAGAEHARVASGRTDYGPVKARLSRLIRRLMAENREAGLAIALVDGRRVVWTKGFGVADTATGRRVTPDTIFHIGSVAKTVTATAVMQLAERGLVDLDAPLSRYIPQFSLHRRFGGGNVITVRSVLDHHAGIPGTLPKGFITTGRPSRGYMPYLLRELRSLPPTQRVNTVPGYDNSGYALMATLVENVTGMGFEAYAQQHLFARMGMRSSNYDDRLAPASRLTRNYVARVSADGEPIGVDVRPREFVNAWGAGSITSTARDMSGYLRMLVSSGRGSAGRVLRPATLREMWTRQSDSALDRLACCSGLGWTLNHPGLDWAGPVVFKGGDTQYAHSMLMVLPRSRLAVAVLTNTSTGEVRGPVAIEALGLAYTAKTGVPRPAQTPLPTSEPAAEPERALRAHAGAYASATGLDRVELAPDGGGLVWTRDAGTAHATSATFTPFRDGWFRSTTDAAQQVAFRTVMGRRLMVTRSEYPPALYTEIRSERLPDGPIPASWSARVGRYRAVGIAPEDTIVPRLVRLLDVDGVLVLELGSEARQVLRPDTRTRAFTFGLGGPLPAEGKGDAVTASHDGGLTYLGVRYRHVGP
jgi:CubicO group peptidase (beta-lactamase class C family)